MTEQAVLPKRKINWIPLSFLIVYQTLLFLLLPFYFYYNTPGTGIIVSAVILLYLTGLSITGGYHRYYAHRSYKTNSFIESLLLFFGSMAIQGSALRWGFDHRLHHANVDTDNDPYSIKKGFWYAHFLWIVEKPRTIDPKIVSDLMRNKLVMFQHRFYPICMLVSNAIAVLFCGWLFNDYLAAFAITFGVRLFALHHFTWFINSLAHTWGDKPFSQEQSAVDNYFLSMLTFGEGYHNYHHTFANDYRNGIKWFHFDPTKWLIWTLSKLGLAHSLRVVDPLTIEKRMVLETKNLLLEQLKEKCHTKKEELEKLLDEMAEQIVAKITQFNELKNHYLESKRENISKNVVSNLRKELKNAKKGLRHIWRQWIRLTNNIARSIDQPAYD